MAQKIHKTIIETHLSLGKFIYLPSQKKLCLPIIERLYNKMLLGIQFSEIKVYDDLIIDGHHRYFAASLAKTKIESSPTQSARATIKHQWNEVEFDEEDWDSASKIQHLNKLDAEYNQMSVNELLEKIHYL